MKVLVDIGLPRGGTTYLYHQLSFVNRGTFNDAVTKETNFFSGGHDAADFRSLFPGDDPCRFYLDISPSYLVSPDPAIDNIIRMEAAEKKIIVHLRHPVDHFFAHYLHELKSSLAPRLIGSWPDQGLLSPRILQATVSRRADAVAKLIDHLGTAAVFVINHRRDFAYPASLARRLGGFLGLELKPFTRQVVGPGGWVPRLHYGGATGTDVLVGNALYRLPPQALLLVNGPFSELWQGIEDTVACRKLSQAASWTREIRTAQFEEIYRCFERDWLALLSLLRQNPDDYAIETHLRAKDPPLDPSVARMLEPTDSLAGRLHSHLDGL